MFDLSRSLLLRCKYLFLACVCSLELSAQINLVTNGSFEAFYVCKSTNYDLINVVGWTAVDSGAFAGIYASTCQQATCCSVPLNQYGYQVPKSGNAYVMTQVFAPGAGLERGYIRNRLKTNLKAGRKYCARCFVNNMHVPKYSINSIGIYLGGTEVDTISNPNLPLPFLYPEVEATSIMFDTLNWVALSGTFVATGNEKYLVFGCFKDNAAVNYSTTNSGTFNIGWAGYNVDDVSCIELDENFAGPDTTIFPGDSLFLGKTNDDDWLDARFSWYSLPGMVPLDTVTGFYARPAVTSSYVVKQEICGYTILDTIVVSVEQDDVRVAEQRAERLRLYPVPANETIRLVTDVPHWYQGVDQYTLTDALGNMVAKGAFLLLAGGFELDVSEYPSGAYTLLLSGPQAPCVVKRIFVTK